MIDHPAVNRKRDRLPSAGLPSSACHRRGSPAEAARPLAPTRMGQRRHFIPPLRRRRLGTCRRSRRRRRPQLQKPALGVRRSDVQAGSVLGVFQVALPVTLGRVATLVRVRHQTTQPLPKTGVVAKNRRLTLIVRSGGGGNRMRSTLCATTLAMRSCRQRARPHQRFASVPMTPAVIAWRRFLLPSSR
jgi:hypothetical protein